MFKLKDRVEFVADSGLIESKGIFFKTLRCEFQIGGKCHYDALTPQGEEYAKQQLLNRMYSMIYGYIHSELNLIKTNSTDLDTSNKIESLLNDMKETI